MNSPATAYPTLPRGTFIRIRADSADPRAGKDLMVIEDDGGDVLAGIIGWDRYNQLQRCECVGHEAWRKDELDWTTVDQPSLRT